MNFGKTLTNRKPDRREVFQELNGKIYYSFLILYSKIGAYQIFIN